MQVTIHVLGTHTTRRVPRILRLSVSGETCSSERQSANFKDHSEWKGKTFSSRVDHWNIETCESKSLQRVRPLQMWSSHMELIAQSSVDHHWFGHLICNRVHLKRLIKVDISIVKIGANVSIRSVVYVCRSEDSLQQPVFFVTTWVSGIELMLSGQVAGALIS